MKRIYVLWALACGFLPSVWAQPNGVTAELRLSPTEYLIGEDMALKVHIENRSGQQLHLGQSADWISFAVYGDDGLPVKSLGEGSLAKDFTVDSAQAADVSFNLTPFFDFRQPGRYVVKASFKIPQWHNRDTGNVEEVTCAPTKFSVIQGLRLSNVPDVAVGLPSADTNAPPEMRRYFLEKVTYAANSASTVSVGGMKLYLRLTDGTGEKTLKTLPLGPLFTFSTPTSQIDRLSNLHVLNQTGGQTFTYTVIDPHGFILDRQTYMQTDARPDLAPDGQGGVVIRGGTRRLSDTDIPPSQQAAATLPATNGRNAP